MKTLLSTLIATALLVPSLSFATSTTDYPNAVGAAVDTTEQMEHKGHKGKHHKMSHEERMAKYQSMTQEEKEAFFDKRIKKMEKRLSKIEDPERKAKMQEKLNEFKSLDTAGKEQWLKENKPKHKKGKHGKKGKGQGEHPKHPDFKKDLKMLESMTQEEKSDFFAKKVERMESHLSKIDDPKRKAHMERKLNEFKPLSVEEKEAWIKKEHKNLKKNKKHMKEMCDKIKSGEKIKMPSDEEAYNRLVNSPRYLDASDSEKSKMMEKFNKMKAKSPEEKQEMFNKRHERLKEKCHEMKKHKHQKN